jgi:ATPase subunit of ABC transporter with duplicated ATPase domains
MARAPKVFTWSDGFHRYTVAATSRAKALQAWETDRDLFKEGVAQEAPDAPDAKAAIAAPGAVIRRAEGGLKSAVDKLPKSTPKRVDEAAEAKRKKALAEAEAAFEAADAEQRDAEADLDRRRRDLDAEAAALSGSWSKRRAKLEMAIARLRR